MPSNAILCERCNSDTFTVFRHANGDLFYTCADPTCFAEGGKAWTPPDREPRQNSEGPATMADAKHESQHLVSTPKGKRQSIALYDRHGAHIGTLHIDSEARMSARHDVLT